MTVTSGSVPSSNEEKLSPGTYYWQADYSGDSEKPAEKSACGTEVALVQTPTSLSTSLSGAGHSGKEIEVGETEAVTDTATLSGTHASAATGYVKYDVYSDSECKELVAEAGDESVTGGSVPKSEEETLPVGTDYWQASYFGDEANHGSTNACGPEISIVTAPVTTSLSGEGQSGDEIEVEETEAVKDTATLHGPHASKATGKVTYRVYSDSACKELVATAGEVTVTSGSVPSSNEEKLSSGDYYWQASYSGDSENPAATSACGTEVAIVRPLKFQYAGSATRSRRAWAAGHTTRKQTRRREKTKTNVTAAPKHIRHESQKRSIQPAWPRQKQKSSSSGHPNSSSVPATAPLHGTCGVAASRMASIMSGSKARLADGLPDRPRTFGLDCRAANPWKNQTKRFCW